MLKWFASLHVIQQRGDQVMTNITISSSDGRISAVGEVASQFVYFTSLLSFALSNKIHSKICYKEEFNRFKIHRRDKIRHELGPFEEFANALLQTLAIRAKKYYHVITFFQSRE